MKIFYIEKRRQKVVRIDLRMNTMAYVM
uniref:Uncharacterized protein n=1 Tax=Lepeophtheirus salmonis TaxID=72036 RepID=A0A0K2UAQ0_LEPSM